MSLTLSRKGLLFAAVALVALFSATTAQGQLITDNTSAFGGGPVKTFNYASGATVGSFVPTGAFGANNGRGIQVLRNAVYYTELSGGFGATDFIRVAPFNGGAGGADVRTLPNPRPGLGVQDLAYHNGVLYALTGYNTGAPIVFGLNPVTGAILSVTAIASGAGSASEDSDGFTVLPNGNFLINNFDTSCTYNQYSPSTGAKIAFTTIVVPGGPTECTGVDTDGTSLFFLTNASEDFFPTPAPIVKTTLAGVFVSSQAVAAGTATGGGEDISIVAFASLSEGLPGVPGQANCHGKDVSFLATSFGSFASAAAALGTTVQELQNAINAACQ
jgi:hypothetical protein